MNKAAHPPIRLGLTGGMGCGKSTATGIFRELGFQVVESDAIVRELWDSDENLKNATFQRWGQRIVAQPLPQNPDSRLLTPGSLLIDRRKVAEVVFADAAELAWLEALLHPLVRRRWLAQVAAQPDQDWVVEIPLLFEKNLASEFKITLCVASSPALQATRLAARGLTPVEVTARQSRQWPLSQKIEQADLVVLNDGSLDFLRREIASIAAQLKHPAS